MKEVTALLCKQGWVGVDLASPESCKLMKVYAWTQWIPPPLQQLVWVKIELKIDRSHIL